ncbi:hypothetical protein MPNT_10222 [Candidatus Methylacidithermus pantelleriae]|uniref:Uncharacterized protein n=1 Tax=Candidatus Methylacidithermus pantelleriae TaxID=2744239 RepID=A0A8J2BQ72_9BACT|nr:hypothetical protein MPNT_10222 [Candidatus Methylacidithermus pantelleriae]
MEKALFFPAPGLARIRVTKIVVADTLLGNPRLAISHKARSGYEPSKLRAGSALTSHPGDRYLRPLWNERLGV